jgi:hypothetical protein
MQVLQTCALATSPPVLIECPKSPIMSCGWLADRTDFVSASIPLKKQNPPRFVVGGSQETQIRVRI